MLKSGYKRKCCKASSRNRDLQTVQHMLPLKKCVSQNFALNAFHAFRFNSGLYNSLAKMLHWRSRDLRYGVTYQNVVRRSHDLRSFQLNSYSLLDIHK
ncbi:hypothetical protein RRG08_011509 [Elysia crispata]|uniref:Uncharacterized protein n=1 Tax=Elysia crispata TaxID=231223 RepID=A0AAE1E5V0_9GAST|nr:hypothetical protein RRG08_011509 [Elysia crispata]